MGIKTRIQQYLGEDTRTRKLRINSLFILICKACTVLINLLYVPLLIDAMSQTNYGIWLSLSSIVSWLFVFDIGIGHGVRNKISVAIAEKRENDARAIISTGYFVLFCIVAFLLALVVAIFPYVNWSKVLNAPGEMNDELTMLTIVVVSCFCLQLMLKLVDAVLFAFQNPAIVAAIVVIHQALGMFIIYLMKYSGNDYSIYNYGMVISIVPVAVMILFSLVYFSFYKRNLTPSIRFISKKCINDVLGLGVRFFAIQLTAVVLFQTNSIIIAHQIDSLAVVEYNVAYKYFGVLLMVFTTMTAPIWSASTEAFTKKDFDWIDKTYRHINKIYRFAVCTGVIMLALSPIAYKLWLHQTVSINWELMVLTLFYYILSIKTSIYASFINGSGKVSLQFYMTVAECFIHIPLAIFLCNLIGIYGVLISLSLVTIINLIWEPIQFNKLRQGKANGIWNK